VERTESLVLAQMLILTQRDPINVGVKAGRPVFILGRNGTGKSALVNNLATQWQGQCIYMPGSRPSYFDNESLSMTPASRRDYASNLAYYNSPDSRWKSVSGTIKNEKAIHDLQVAETQYKLDAANQIKAEGAESSAIARLLTDDSPLDIVNSILSQANLAVQLEVAGGELRASQAGVRYSYARMSDGERSALIFSAEVVAAPSGTIFLIDEPELHLHPSIVIALIKALILTRPDCGFVVCTHELGLPIAVQGGEIVLVRSCAWHGGTISSWEVTVIDDPKQIPEWLWVDVIGARHKILFIEGDDKASLDQPLYSLLFPAVSVRPLASCRDVMRAVEGLRAVEGVHRTSAFGLIDHDGMSDDQMRKFEAGGIYPLPIYSVESLIYSLEAQHAVALLQSEVLGLAHEVLLDDALRTAIDSLKIEGKKEHLASRLAERHMRDKILSMIPTRQALMNPDSGDVGVTFKSPYPDELGRLTSLVEANDLQGIVCRYPVRESGVLNGIAKGLRFNSRDDYERAVLRRVYADSSLRNALRMKLSNLAAVLE
jgi:ABC-type cobalamin/Fe3+-siderophores transport system ATPase subunit